MRNPKSSTFKILKLRSGEELIAQIKGMEKDKLILERPMIFRNIIIQDSKGYPKEITTLKSWISLTNDLYAKIPYDFVVSFITPNEDALMMYSNQKMKEDLNPPITTTIKDSFPVNNTHDKLDLKDPMELLNILNKMREELGMENADIEDMDIEDEEDEMSNMVAMTIFFPPSVLTHLLDSGMINDEHIKKMIQEINKSPDNNPNKNKAEENTPGNNPSDWGSTVEDYLPEDSKYLQKKKRNKKNKEDPKGN